MFHVELLIAIRCSGFIICSVLSFMCRPFVSLYPCFLIMMLLL